MSNRYYSLQILDHFDDPRHSGVLDPQDPGVCTGQVESSSHDEVIQFQLKIDNRGIIKAIAWQALGNPVIIAGCSLLSELVLNQPLAEAAQIKADDLAEKLAVPKLRFSSILLVEEALQKAIRAIDDKF